MHSTKPCWVRVAGATLLAMLPASGCVFVDTRPRSVVPGSEVTVKSPLKVHLSDGSTAVFSAGATFTGALVKGTGRLYGLKLEELGEIQEIALDRVAAVESFSTKTDATLSFMASLGAAVAGYYGGAFLYAAIFGSCPTVYATVDNKPVLQAETFSASIAPLLEARDLDRLEATPAPDGRVTLDVRNEALETHYINHLQLVEVRHRRGERAVPDSLGRPIVLAGETKPVAIVDRAGRDLRTTLGERDDRIFKTDADRLKAAGLADLDDWIDLRAPVTPGAKQVAVVLRARSSLLNTVLFYDVILARSGPRALDWLSTDLANISRAVELGRWYRRRMGLRVSVPRGGAHRDVAWVPDAGPIAWRDVAVVVPVEPGATEARIRLSFTADSWRFDRVGVASVVPARATRSIAASEVRGPAGTSDAEALADVRAPDEAYLVTSPGQRFSVTFDAGDEPRGEERTFLLGSQGYYTEWIRGRWIREARGSAPFAPSDEALLAALGRWRVKQASFEKAFHEKRVPVRP